MCKLPDKAFILLQFPTGIQDACKTGLQMTVRPKPPHIGSRHLKTLWKSSGGKVVLSFLNCCQQKAMHPPFNTSV